MTTRGQANYCCPLLQAEITMSKFFPNADKCCVSRAYAG